MVKFAQCRGEDFPLCFAHFITINRYCLSNYKNYCLLNGLERCKVFLKFGDDHKCRSRTSVKTSPEEIFKMKETEIQKEKSRRTVRGELALMVAVAINSLGVVLMLHSGAGISAISSVPYAFSEVFTRVSLGTWTYIFQGLLVLSLMILRKKFVPQYLFSFVVGFAFSELLDVHESWINVLPLTPGYRVIYFLISYILLCIGIALSNRCKLPIIPTDLFPRELSDITSVTYSKIKVGFDVTCLAVTAGLTFAFLGHLDGLGIGTILAAFTMGKVIGLIGKWMDRHACFVSFMTQRQTA